MNSNALMRSIAAAVWLSTLHGFCQVLPPSIDLRPYGYKERSRDSSALGVVHLNGQLTYIDSQLLLASFIIPNEAATLASRDGISKSGRWLLRTTLWDSKTGVLKNESECCTALPDTYLYAIGVGRYLTATSGWIYVYGAEGNKIWQHERPRTTVWPAVPYASLLVSPTGNTLLIISDLSRASQLVEVYRTRDFLKIGSFLIPYQAIPETLRASDDSIAYRLESHNNWEVYTKSFSGDAHHIAQCQEYLCDAVFDFAGKDLLIVEGPRSIRLVDKVGNVLNEHSIGNEHLSSLRPSTDGHRLFLLLVEEDRGSSWLDRFPKVVSARFSVLDTATFKEIATLPLDPKHHKLEGWAISPSGDSVAYLEDGLIRFWSAPFSH